MNEAKLKLNGQTFFKTEENRIRNVILKLARGHASFENGGLFLQEPSLLRIQSISNMNEIEKTKYFTLNMKLLPEVGIRALQRLIINEEIISEGWTVVQENKYMYSISQDYMNLCVKFLICNYLACEVIWDLTLI